MKKVMIFRKVAALIAAGILATMTGIPQSALAADNGLIGGCAYEDANGNNIKDLQEECFPNVTIRITGKTSEGQLVTREVLTDENGWFFFRNLPAGTYTITKLNLPSQTADRFESIAEFGVTTIGGVVNLQVSNLPASSPRQQIADVIKAVTITNDTFTNIPLATGGELVIFFFGHTRLCSAAPGPNCRPDLVEVGTPPPGDPPPPPSARHSPWPAKRSGPRRRNTPAPRTAPDRKSTRLNSSH